jgi:signal-transduction protein with cAMP-binding, CBS, and nucleotidyltransferase domain
MNKYNGGLQMKMSKVLSEKLARGHEAIYSIPGICTLRQAAVEMTEKKIGAMLVECNAQPGEFSGILTERDIIRCCAGDRNLDEVIVSEVMNSNMVSVDVDEPLRSVVALMAESHIRHIVLTREGRIVALVSIRDIMHANDQEKDITIAELSDFVGCNRRNNVY